MMKNVVMFDMQNTYIIKTHINEKKKKQSNEKKEYQESYMKQQLLIHNN